MVKVYSSKSFDDGSFRAHGNFDAHIEDNVYICSVTGPLNLEGIIALGKARRACFSQIKQSSIIPTIVVLSNSMLMSAEAFGVYAANLKHDLQCIKSTLLMAYVVPDDIEGRAIMMPMFDKIFSENNIVWQIFDNLNTAKAWIQSNRQS